MRAPFKMPKELQKQLRHKNKLKVPAPKRFRGTKGRHVLLTPDDVIKEV